ncbi:hypothetical protein [Caproiciproducens sp. LBM24188]|nr:hypothetical protein [Oscillospiraceae bacterium]HHV32970.1 hypothetical protein [Clostridiales bacterium]
MPRGVQKTDEQKLQILDAQIAELESRKTKIEEKIKALNDQKQVIFDQQQQKKLEELQKFISRLGKTPEEVLEILKKAE